MHFTESFFNVRKFYPGLIDFLVSSEPIARALRDFVEFKIIPMINPDGVFNGNERYFPYYNSCECSDCGLKFHYKRRSSMVGADLNRVWNDYSEYFHPTVKAAMDAIRHLDDQPVRLVQILKHSQNIYLQQLVINYLKGFKFGIHFGFTCSSFLVGYLSIRQFLRRFPEVYFFIRHVCGIHRSKSKFDFL